MTSKRVRIEAGEWRGRGLSYPQDRFVRPTMQKVKASVFNTLGAALRGAVFADVYCGAGGMGLEALSQGASFVHFVDTEPRAITALLRNLDDLGVPAEHYRVHRADVRLLAPLDPAPVLVYGDPPYAQHDLVEAMLAKFAPGVYDSLDRVVVEHDASWEPIAAAGMAVWRRKTFGDTTVSYFCPEE